MIKLQIRPREPGDQDSINSLLEKAWGSTRVVARGRLVDAALLPGFVAVQHDRLIGLATFEIAGAECELISLNSLEERNGVGTGLIDAVKHAARDAECRRVVVVTTNDNLHALRFYQRRGFCLVALRPNAMDQARKLKPQIPLLGLDDIPLRDELELALPLA